MMGIMQVQGLLDVQVTLKSYKGQDQYGRPTLGASRLVKARVEQGTIDARSPTGRSLPGRYKVILGEAIAVDPRDQITLPKEFGVRDEAGVFKSAQPPILEVRPVFYRGRHDHTVLILG